jgi:sugar lactone lactonase YvrE
MEKSWVLQVRKKLTSFIVPVALIVSIVGISPASAASTILGKTGSLPSGITIDSDGNIYTANFLSNNVSKITPDGLSTILEITDSLPSGITIDSAGNIFTANFLSNNVSKITPDGLSTILGTTGDQPFGITIDSAGNIYTANNGSDSVSKITPDGASTILGTTGDQPLGITIDSAGNIYTANNGSDSVSKITPDGISTILGTTGDQPFGITIDSAGNIYTANFLSNNVSKITPDGISTILGTTGDEPFGITIDSAGNIYTTNTRSNNVSKIIRPTTAEELAAAAREAAANREAAKQSARIEIVERFKNAQKATVELFNRAEILGITPGNIDQLHVDIFALPQTSRAEITQVLKVARKYEVLGIIASEQVRTIYSHSLIEIGLISKESRYKETLTRVVKALPLSDRSSYAGIKDAIEAELAAIQARKDRLAKILTQIASR